MSRNVKLIFALFNTILLLCNYVFVAFFPKFLVFGWLPFQLAFFYFSMLLAAIVWGLYYKAFFNTQKHVDELYGDE